MTAATDPTRRHVLRVTGVTAIGVALAGCSGSGEEDDGGDGSDGDGDDGSDGGDGGDGADFGGWLDDANGDTGVVDHTGEDEVTVDVGTGSTNLAFDPAAIRIDAGTTVVWEWTGDGGSHDVVDTDGAFESDRVMDEGATFEHAFEDAGTFTYSCIPHETQGMKGAVEVV